MLARQMGGGTLLDQQPSAHYIHLGWLVESLLTVISVECFKFQANKDSMSY